MMTEDEFQERNNNLSLDDIDLSLLRLTSPPYDHSSSFFSADELSPPLKRSSPVSDEYDHPKRRKLSPQNPIFITSPLFFTSLETGSSSIHDPTLFPNLPAGNISPVSEKQETTPSASDTETMKMVNNCVEEMNRGETNYGYEKQQEEEEEEDCGGGMRIERSGDGYIIRLKCRCRQAFRVLFSDHYLYFKPLQSFYTFCCNVFSSSFF